MIQTDDLGQLRVFAACARRLNFRRAAEELGLKPATVSERIRGLETKIGVRLLNRTTRSVALTEPGAALLAELEPALERIDAALTAAGRTSPTPGGRIRINGPRPALEYRLAPLLAGFLAAHPRVEVELVGEDGFVDVVAQGFDAGVRFTESLSRDMVAVSLGAPHRFRVVAAPRYLAGHGEPRTPGDLVGHNCLAQIFPSGRRLPWDFERAGQSESLVPQGTLATSEPSAQLLAALGGVGVAYLFSDHCDEAITDGRLVSLLEDWLPPFPTAYLYYSERRLMPPALRALIDFIKHHRRG